MTDDLVISSVKSLASKSVSECITLLSDEEDISAIPPSNYNNSVIQTKRKRSEGDPVRDTGSGKPRCKRAKLTPAVPTRDLMKVFTEKCRTIDPSPDMDRILDLKIMKLYKKFEEHYVSSSSFSTILSDLLSKLSNRPQDVYVFISHLREELKAFQPKPEKSVKTDVHFKSERDRQNAAKLSKTLDKLHKIIKQLESDEVSWESENENDSSYIQLQRYKQRAADVHRKLCTITQECQHAGRIKKIVFSGSPFKQVNVCIERFVNSTGQFPDYHDILDIVSTTNTDNKLNLKDAELESIARSAFTEVGKELQRLRKYDDAESVYTLIEDNAGDPADEDPELQEKLNMNKEHWNNINEVIDEFVVKQEKKNKGEDSDDEEDEEEEDEEDDSDEDMDEEDSNDDSKDGGVSDFLSKVSGDEDDEKQVKDMEETNEEEGVNEEKKKVEKEEMTDSACSDATLHATNGLDFRAANDASLIADKLNGDLPLTNLDMDVDADIETSISKVAETLNNQTLSNTIDLVSVESQETDLCESVVSSTEGKLPRYNPPSNDSSDCVILDSDGEESSEPVQTIKKELPDEQLPHGRIKVRSIASLGGSDFS